MSDRIARIADEIATGVQPSLPMDKKVLWAESNNVIYREGSVQPAPSQTILFIKPEAAPIRGAVESVLSGVPNLFFGTQKKLYRAIKGAATPTDVSRASGGDYTGIKDATTSEAATTWSFTRFGTWILATNGKDRPQIWKLSSPTHFVKWEEVAGSGNDLGDPGAPITTAQIVRTIGPYVLLLNTSNGTEVYEWCDTDNPHVFTPTAANAAGQDFIRDLHSDIIAAEPLGKGLGVYGRNELHIINFVGSPAYFGNDHLITGVGAVGKNAVCSIGRLHYGMSKDGLFATDGVDVRYFDEPVIRKFIYDNLNLAQITKTAVWYDQHFGIFFVSYPSGDSIENDTTVGFYLAGVAFSPHNFGRTFGSAGGVFDSPILFDADGNIWRTGAQGEPPPSPGLPLTLEAEASFTAGFGMLGYGMGGWGGVTEVVG